MTKEYNLFLLSNVVYSGSTYIVMLFVPYLLNIEKMAEFSSVYNALMILLFIFEFGISMSFLRFYRIKKITYLINSLVQMMIFFLLFIIIYTSFGSKIFLLLNLDVYDISKTLFFLALIAHLSWIFAKNILLSSRKYVFMIFLAVSILVIRIVGFYYFSTLKSLTINKALLLMFVIPFALIFVYVVINNSHKLLLLGKNLFNRRLAKVFLINLKRFIKFSLATYVIGMLYILTSRYPIIYLSDNGNFEILADLGFAMTFLGIITIASVTFRTYFIANFHLGDIDAIKKHLNKFLEKVKPYSLIGMLISGFVSFIAYLIKPAYLSVNSSIFIFIILSSYTFIFLMSLITFLSKTMNYNFLEFKINSLRLILVFAICHLVFLNYPVLGFALINLVMVASEFIFAKIILKRLNYVK